ncbi:MAG: diguanylate cyclase [Spirochaetaceae bacterium]|nr:MAG: diguanylate cyclase [Spirochaetaceae bacterium]
MTSAPQAALSIAQRVHRTAVSSRDDSKASQALLIAGWAQVKLSSYEDALASFERALVQSGAVGDDDGRLHALTGIGVVYHRVSQFDIALDCFDEVLSEAQSSGFRAHETGALHHIGEVCEAMQRHEQALEFYLRAREVAGQDNAVDTLTALDVAIGDVYRKLHRSEPALEHLNRALKAATAQSDGIARAECLTSLGRLYQDLGDLPAAERCHRESIALYEAAGNRFGLMEAQHHLGWLLQQVGKDGQALEVYRAAIENGEKIDAGAHAHKSYLRASQLFEKSGQERLALDYYRRSVELRAQLSNDLLRQRVGGIMAGFDRERQEADPDRVRVRVGELRQKTEALAEANRRLTVIGNIGRDITGALDLGTLMLAVHSAINSLLPGDTLGLGVYDEASRQVEYRFFIEAGQALDPITVDIDDPGSIGAWCVLQRKEAVIGDMDKDYERYVPERPLSVGSRSKSAVYFPLIVRDRAIGVLTVQSRRAHAYREREIETLRVLSSYIAVALENSLVHERLIQLNGELTREKAELERANQLIRHMANHDNLTGLPNRRLLYDVIEKYVPLARRQKSTFVILYIDLDGFKPVNDHYGHAAGDTVLRTVAARLEASVRSSDVVARIGGDEFVLVFRDVTDLDAVNATIEKLIGRIQEPISLEGESITIRPSGGAAVFPRDGDDFEQLLLLADEAMYRVKAAADTRRWAFYRD